MPYATPTTNQNTRATRAGREQTANNEQIKNASEAVKSEVVQKSGMEVRGLGASESAGETRAAGFK
jgi:hypothetical protein